MLLFKGILMIEEHLVQLPEAALGGGGLGCFGGVAGVGMFGAGKVAPDETETVAEAAPNLTHNRLIHLAEGALEVAVLDQRDPRGGRSHEMILVVDRGAERWIDPVASRSLPCNVVIEISSRAVSAAHLACHDRTAICGMVVSGYTEPWASREACWRSSR